MIGRLKKQYRPTRKLIIMLKTELNAPKISASGAVAIVVIRKSFGLIIFSPMPPHVHIDFVTPLLIVAKCNRLLRLGRPYGAVTLSR
jgi:hypothetical protein